MLKRTAWHLKLKKDSLGWRIKLLCKQICALCCCYWALQHKFAISLNGGIHSTEEFTTCLQYWTSQVCLEHITMLRRGNLVLLGSWWVFQISAEEMMTELLPVTLIHCSYCSHILIFITEAFYCFIVFSTLIFLF